VTAETVESFLRSREISAARTAPNAWALAIPGEAKHQIGVLFALGEHTLRAESFFMRRPLENDAEVYAMLLRRNRRASPARFALDDIGDIYITAEIPASAVTEDELDRLLGAIVLATEETFAPALEVGFATYLAADRAWRSKAAREEESRA
jgi:putative sensory transduction regulator